MEYKPVKDKPYLSGVEILISLCPRECCRSWIWCWTDAGLKVLLHWLRPPVTSSTTSLKSPLLASHRRQQINSAINQQRRRKTPATVPLRRPWSSRVLVVVMARWRQVTAAQRKIKSALLGLFLLKSASNMCMILSDFSSITFVFRIQRNIGSGVCQRFRMRPICDYPWWHCNLF